MVEVCAVEVIADAEFAIAIAAAAITKIIIQIPETLNFKQTPKRLLLKNHIYIFVI